MRFAIASLLFLLAGCSPGMLDYTDRIDDTNYNITRTDSQSHWLYPNADCGNGCPSISSDVVKYRSNKSAIAVRRQVVKLYFCDGPMVTSQRLNSYQQYVILLRSNRLVGPMSSAAYLTFVKENPVEMAGIDLLSEKDRIDGNGAPLNSIDHCRNAKPA